MLILLGYLVVLGTVFGGYLMTGGSLGALYQPAELVIIAGAGIGSFIVGNNGKAIKGTLKALPLLFRRSKYTKAMYMDLLALLYRLMAKSRQMGMFSLERDIENPRESEIFASYPRILADSVMLDFIVDYLRLIISGHMNTFEIEALMDEEIETHESEAEVPANSLALVGDSLPAFGIVAAVSRQEMLGAPPVLLVNHALRPLLSRFLRRSLPQLVVLSNLELSDNRHIRMTAIIGGK